MYHERVDHKDTALQCAGLLKVLQQACMQRLGPSSKFMYYIGTCTESTAAFKLPLFGYGRLRHCLAGSSHAEAFIWAVMTSFYHSSLVWRSACAGDNAGAAGRGGRVPADVGSAAAAAAIPRRGRHGRGRTQRSAPGRACLHAAAATAAGCQPAGDPAVAGLTLPLVCPAQGCREGCPHLFVCTGLYAINRGLSIFYQAKLDVLRN